jgi:hypothetical protein
MSEEQAEPNQLSLRAEPVVAVLNAVKRGPYAAILTVGLLILLAAFIRKIGSIEVAVADGSQQLMLGVGIALLAVALVAPGVGAVRRQRMVIGGYTLPSEASDVDFMFNMFYLAMPPAFVKRIDDYDHDAGTFSSHDIMYSKAFDRFQGPNNLVRHTDTVKDQVAQDHHDGDKRALEKGRSYQIEYPPNYRLPILTMKLAFTHKNRRYIAGWYIPIDAGSVSTEKNSAFLKVVRDQAKMRPSIARQGVEDYIDAAIGHALRPTTGQSPLSATIDHQ